MPTEKQIAAQLKREATQAKQDRISRVQSAVMNILYNSDMYGSKLWPKRGFIPSRRSLYEKLDTITVGIRILDDCDYKKVRFNLWGKERRVIKQQEIMIMIFDQSIYDGIYFYPEYPQHIDKLSAHYHDECIMAMLDFKFTID